MSKRLTPYGSGEHARIVSKVGKGKTPQGLVARMPSVELAAKVGPNPTITGRTVRVVRRNARS